MSQVEVQDQAQQAQQAQVAPVAVQEPRRMRADAARNREALLVAARALFAERGSDTRLEEVAKRAGVGVGTLYRHFPTRTDLVAAVYREDVDGLVDLARDLADRMPAWPALVAWLEGFVRYVQAKHCFLTELHEAFERDPGAANELRAKVRAAGGVVLRRAQHDGVARGDVDEGDLIQLVGGMCLSKGATSAQNARLLVLVLDGLRAAPAGR